MLRDFSIPKQNKTKQRYSDVGMSRLHVRTVGKKERIGLYTRKVVMEIPYEKPEE